ncbi:chorismate--pyruvate lyase family protein [Methanobacterium petrolearium]|uniref:chorismate--pyruvate lyase family protein n=1 Tax=Methanobacterium petrolearium TaxID=710190 RepID=UPI001AE9925A|nr:chorismate lyase [Methanobacterium petrolearium]MBP1946889.1 chorismate-pyruvate lyase [Methanobacterium petrolearium]
MDQKIFEGIQDIEQELGNLSSAQKILLATDGSVTTILDVLKGHVNIRTLVQEFRKADAETAFLLDVDEGATINYRVVVIEGKEPLIYAISLIPVERLDDDFREDLIRADIPIGRILRKHNIESRREIKTVSLEESDPEMVDIFKTNSPMLTRTYNIIHKDQVLVWLMETFPCDLFTD